MHAPYNAGAYGDPVIELRNAEATVVWSASRARTTTARRSTPSTPACSTASPYACPLEFSRGNQVMIDMIYAAAGSPL